LHWRGREVPRHHDGHVPRGIGSGTLSGRPLGLPLAALEVGAVDAVAKPAPGVPAAEAFADLAETVKVVAVGTLAT
jgi:hypothetical protein